MTERSGPDMSGPGLCHKSLLAVQLRAGHARPLHSNYLQRPVRFRTGRCFFPRNRL